MIAGLVIPALATLVLGGVDVSQVMSERARLLAIAEGAALTGARALATTTGEHNAAEQAKAFAAAEVTAWPNAPTVTVAARVEPYAHGAKSVRVTLEGQRPSLFGDLLPPGGWHMSVSATAISNRAEPLCVLAFDAASKSTLHLLGSPVIEAPACLVHSNGDVLVDGGKILAAQTEAARNARGSILPAAITDAPVIADPFAALKLKPSECGAQMAVLKIETGRQTIAAGVHCDNIHLGGDAIVTLAPGDHWFFDGTLKIAKSARLQGQDVVLIFGDKGKLQVKDDAVLSLQGRESGQFAGFVMIASRKNSQQFELDSTHVERLDGVLYQPAAELLISGASDVARQSDWTVIVAHRLTLTGNPHLFLNADYGGSDLAPPTGVGPRQGAPRLVD